MSGRRVVWRCPAGTLCCRVLVVACVCTHRPIAVLLLLSIPLLLLVCACAFLACVCVCVCGRASGHGRYCGPPRAHATPATRRPSQRVAHPSDSSSSERHQPTHATQIGTTGRRGERERGCPSDGASTRTNHCELDDTSSPCGLSDSASTSRALPCQRSSSVLSLCVAHTTLTSTNSSRCASSASSPSRTSLPRSLVVGTDRSEARPMSDSSSPTPTRVSYQCALNDKCMEHSAAPSLHLHRYVPSEFLCAPHETQSVEQARHTLHRAARLNSAENDQLTVSLFAVLLLFC